MDRSTVFLLFAAVIAVVSVAAFVVPIIVGYLREGRKTAHLLPTLDRLEDLMDQGEEVSKDDVEALAESLSLRMPLDRKRRVERLLRYAERVRSS